MDDKQRALRVLETCQGRDSAITAKTLAAQIGATDRGARRIVTELRRQGYPIASAVRPPHGYFIPATPEEAEECQAQLYSRIRETAITARALGRAFGTHLPSKQMMPDLFDEGA